MALKVAVWCPDILLTLIYTGLLLCEYLLILQLYFFSVEFGICIQDGKLRAFGAGLLSSVAELKVWISGHHYLYSSLFNSINRMSIFTEYIFNENQLCYSNYPRSRLDRLCLIQFDILVQVTPGLTNIFMDVEHCPSSSTSKELDGSSYFINPQYPLLPL